MDEFGACQFVSCKAMELPITTPALLFPAISLILLAYTNRFLAIASLIRSLYAQYRLEHDPRQLRQIQNLLHRIRLIRNMQWLGTASFVLAIVSMGLVFFNIAFAATYVFGGSLACLLASLVLAMHETRISVDALKVQLEEIQHEMYGRRKQS